MARPRACRGRTKAWDGGQFCGPCRNDNHQHRTDRDQWRSWTGPGDVGDRIPSRDRNHPAHRRNGGAGQERPRSRVQRRRRGGNHIEPDGPGPWWNDPAFGGLQIQLVSSTDRQPHADGHRRFHLPDRQHNHDRVELEGLRGGRGAGVRCLLAGRELGHFRHGDTVSGQCDGADQHHHDHRRQPCYWARDGTERRGDPGHQRDHSADRHVRADTPYRRHRHHQDGRQPDPQLRKQRDLHDHRHQQRARQRHRGPGDRPAAGGADPRLGDAQHRRLRLRGPASGSSDH